MINEDIIERKYIEIVDNTRKYWKYEHEQYENDRPKSNQLGRFFATAKTYKFDSIIDITLNQLKLRPIVDQTGKYVYNASKVVAKNLKLLPRANILLTKH